MFAVVTISGKQFTVSPGDTIEVGKIDGKAGDEVTFEKVLLTKEKGKIQVGNPTVGKVSVKAKILEQGKGEKLDIRRFKHKVRYRRKIGFRPMITKLEIVSVG